MRLEKRLVKVLRGLAEFEGLSLAQLTDRRPCDAFGYPDQLQGQVPVRLAN